MSSGYSAKTMDETANSEYSEDDLVENNLNTAHCSTSPPTKIRRVEKASVPEQAESKSRIIEFTFDEGVTDPQVNNICLFLNVSAHDDNATAEPPRSEENGNDNQDRITLNDNPNVGSSFPDASPNNRNCDSPCSSLHSASSAEYLYKTKRAIQTGEEKRKSCGFKLVLPKEWQKLFEGYLNDPSSQQRLIKLLHTDMKSHCLSLGNDCEFRKCLETLKLEDNVTFLGRVGKFYMDKYVQKSEKLNSEMNQDQHSTPLPTRAEAEETESLLTPSGVYSAVDVKIPASDTQEGKHNVSLSITEAQELISGEQKIFNVGQREFERAYDPVLKHEDNRRCQIVKVGQVLFDCVFNLTEICNSTLKGQKDKEKFNADKIRFIDRATAWLITKPAVRSVESFEISVKQDLRLASGDFEILKKAVFTEYAYQRRKKRKTI